MAREISAMLKQATSVAHLILHPPYPKIPPPVLWFGVVVPLPSPTLHHVLGMQTGVVFCTLHLNGIPDYGSASDVLLSSRHFAEVAQGSYGNTN